MPQAAAVYLPAHLSRRRALISGSIFQTHLEELLRSSREELLAAESLMKCLITLGSSSMSTSLLIRHILSQISALADQLWQAFQDLRFQQ
ncbi:hypothetical protein PAMP_014509 [Pampus punctatissimus]